MKPSFSYLFITIPGCSYSPAPPLYSLGQNCTESACRSKHLPPAESKQLSFDFPLSRNAIVHVLNSIFENLKVMWRACEAKRKLFLLAATCRHERPTRSQCPIRIDCSCDSIPHVLPLGISFIERRLLQLQLSISKLMRVIIFLSQVLL